MKKPMILVFSLLASLNILFADFGSSTTYFGKFYLKNGDNFTAYIEYSGYEDAAWLDVEGQNPYCSDEGMYQLLSEINELANYYVWSDGGIQKEDQMKCLVVYKNIFSIQPKGIKSYHGMNASTMGFVRQEDVVIFPFEELEKVVFISAEPTKRQWLGSEIIVTTQGMIDTLQNEKYWNEHFVANNEEVFQDGFLLINYSDRINSAELERLSELKKHLMDYRLFWEKYEKKLGVWPQCSMSDDDTRMGMELMEKQVQELREWLRKRGVLLVEMYFTC